MGKINLTDKRHGILTVVRESGRDKFGRMVWLCRCDCGKTRDVSANNLRSGNTKSCGCLRSVPRNRIDLVGKRFGRLVVLGYSETTSGQCLWECVCDCGAVANVKATRLLRGHTRSCGCLRLDICRTSRLKGGNTIGPVRWSKIVKEDGACVKCLSRNNLRAHHLIPVSRDMSLGRDLSNGAVLCESCHVEFHRIYGKHDATVSDFCRFVGMCGLLENAFVSFVGWRVKNGIDDLKKARHFIDLLIEMEEQK